MQELKQLLKKCNSRIELWQNFINSKEIHRVAEIGVYRGEFARAILQSCPQLRKYIMVDPWRNIKDWNKPANTTDEEFENFYFDALANTKFARDKLKILKGKTTEVIGGIPEESLDFIYIDGDHTLKGITIDLCSSWSKIHENGYIAGDDFCSSIWQHDAHFEPTLVFPFAIYFAEAMDVKIFALPFNQFLIAKGLRGFEFINYGNGKYSGLNLLDHLQAINRVRKPKKSFLLKILRKFKKK